MADLIGVGTLASAQGENLGDKNYTKLKSKTDLTNEFLTREDAELLVKQLNTELNLIHKQLDLALQSFSQEIKTQLVTIGQIATEAPVVPTDGGASFKTYLATNLLSRVGLVSPNWVNRNVNLRLVPPKIGENRLFTEARVKQAGYQAPLTAAEKTATAIS